MMIQDEHERVKTEHEVQYKKGFKKLGSQLRQPGHTLFEVNTQTGEIAPASYKDAVGHFHGGTSLKVEVKPGCVYVQALNKKNAMKRYKRGY